MGKKPSRTRLAEQQLVDLADEYNIQEFYEFGGATESDVDMILSPHEYVCPCCDEILLQDAFSLVAGIEFVPYRNGYTVYKAKLGYAILCQICKNIEDGDVTFDYSLSVVRIGEHSLLEIYACLFDLHGYTDYVDALEYDLPEGCL